MVSERGIFSRASDGAMPGVVAGLTVGASRAYLSSRADAEQTAAALAKAASSARPPRLPTHVRFHHFNLLKLSTLFLISPFRSLTFCVSHCSLSPLQLPHMPPWVACILELKLLQKV